jgi:hypothetical protein
MKTNAALKIDYVEKPFFSTDIDAFLDRMAGVDLAKKIIARFENSHISGKSKIKLAKSLSRYLELFEFAKEDNIEASIDSFTESFLLLASYAFSAPSIFLHDDGHFRLLWAKDDQQAAFKFLGDYKIRYVIFAKRDGFIARSSGEDTIENIIPLIKFNALEKLVFEK